MGPRFSTSGFTADQTVSPEMALVRENDVALGPQKVAFLTLHAARALEFPLVLVAGGEDGPLSLRLPGRTPVDVEEERRL